MPNIALRQNVTYRGRIVISAPSWAYSQDTIVKKLSDAGFEQIQIWDEANELPSDWRADKRGDVSGFGQSQVYLEGVWYKETGDGYPSGGDKWKLVDYWIFKEPPAVVDGEPPVDCVTEGYTCAANGDCCETLECKQDVNGKYGGGNRCTPSEKTIATPKSRTGAVVAVGLTGIGLGGLAWWLLKRR